MSYIPPSSVAGWDRFIAETMDEADTRLNQEGMEYLFYRMMKMASMNVGKEKFQQMANRAVATYGTSDKL